MSTYDNVVRRDDGIQLSTANNRVGSPLEYVPVNSVTPWQGTGDLTAALRLSVDSTVLFQGQPTLRITIPAGTSGACKIGTGSAALGALIPYLSPLNDFACAVRYSGFTGYDWSSTFPPQVAMYLGDLSFTNFWITPIYSGSNFPEDKARSDEWAVGKPEVSTWAVGSGTPVASLTDGSGHINQEKLRLKLQWTQVSQTTDCYIWIGFIGAMPARKKPTIIWSIDDGYSSWYSFIAPLFKHYDMPVSMAIDSGLVGVTNYMTADQIRELAADSSQLFDFVNHGVRNQDYNTLGASRYYATVEVTRKHLRGLGVTDDGPLHHPYVQSVWGNDLVDLMTAGGYLSARASNVVLKNGKDQLITDDKTRWLLNLMVSLINTKTLADAKTVVDDIVAAGTMGMINAHDFLATAATTYQWPFSDMRQLVGYVAALRDAGSLEVKSWSRWYADLTGRPCSRR